jgi:hypothetical protein
VSQPAWDGSSRLHWLKLWLPGPPALQGHEPPSSLEHTRQGQPSSLGAALRVAKGFSVMSFTAIDPCQSQMGSS